jgi:hypothetical protein
MTIKPIKLIKNAERQSDAIQPEVAPAAGTSSWSTTVRSWVVEFKQNRHAESLPAFDSLFKDDAL